MFYLCTIFINMKLIITESKRNDIVIKWLDKYYGDLFKHSSPGSIKYIHFIDKNNNTIFDYNRSSSIVEFRDDVIQELVSIFNLNVKNINEILIPWLKKNYNLHVEKVNVTTWYCNDCGRYHITRHHTED